MNAPSKELIEACKEYIKVLDEGRFSDATESFGNMMILLGRERIGISGLSEEVRELIAIDEAQEYLSDFLETNRSMPVNGLRILLGRHCPEFI